MAQDFLIHASVFLCNTACMDTDCPHHELNTIKEKLKARRKKHEKGDFHTKRTKDLKQFEKKQLVEW